MGSGPRINEEYREEFRRLPEGVQQGIFEDLFLLLTRYNQHR